MAEDKEISESGCEAEGGLNPVAVALALGGASREKADAFLDDQRALIADQRHHLHEQLKQLHLTVFDKWIGAMLRVATLCVGIAAAGGVGYLIWDAAHSNGVIIEPFSVPPDMATQGLSGEVIAGQMLDHLAQMQKATATSRPAQSYARNWGNDLKVEIPETGISIGEIQRFLREWLGHDTRISGEVYHTPTGIAISVRSGGFGGEPISGTQADLEGMIQKAAEQVYGDTQPYRYANYLDRNIYRPGATLRIAEAEAIYRHLIYDPDPLERAWAWNGLGTIAYSHHGNIQEAIRDYQKALEVQPDLPIALNALGAQESSLSHYEAALSAWRRDLDTAKIERGRDGIQRLISDLLGDYGDEARICIKFTQLPNDSSVINHDLYQHCAMQSLAGQHDRRATRSWIRDIPPLEATFNRGRRATALLQAEAALENWRAVAEMEPDAEKANADSMPGFDLKNIFARSLRPYLALAKARMGDVAGGEALADSLPADCYTCLRARARIADLAGTPSRADLWFGKAVQSAPSIPFAYHDWGRSLLRRGQPDAAIEKFKLSNEKGPHFADPLEGWGEALMAKNQSHLALEKFAEAEKYAPNWGRLHLKWGEALAYSGNKAEAAKQFARAAQLDLTPAEKSELARHP